MPAATNTGEQIIGQIKLTAHLKEIILRARRMQDTVLPIARREAGRVHFRPSTTGVDMVGLLPERPLQGRPAIRKLKAFVEQFEQEFQTHCVEARPLRIKPEKLLQAFLIRAAYQNAAELQPINTALAAAGDERRLRFVTDDLPVPHGGSRFACDMLALHGAGEKLTPVVIELARRPDDAHNEARALEYSAVVDSALPLFGELFGALLGETLELGRSEAWLLRPPGGPSASGLAQRGLTLLTYRPSDGGEFEIQLGDG